MALKCASKSDSDEPGDGDGTKSYQPFFILLCRENSAVEIQDGDFDGEIGEAIELKGCENDLSISLSDDKLSCFRRLP